MKPNVALSLSFEGISLLCRVKDGWHRLGDVSLASDNLGAELEALRALAEEAGGPDFRTKLILPNDQIKYLLIDSGRGSRAKREAAAAEALQTETPYSADELAFDVVAEGRMTHVAAVARETLAEAEAFAVEHQFNPVSFVAIPPAESYPNEPTFDLTTVAADLLGNDPLDADDEIIRVVSSGPLPAEPEPQPMPEPQPEPESEQITPPKAAAKDAEPNEEAAEAPIVVSDKAPDADVPLAGFSSIRAHRDAPNEPTQTLGGAKRSVTGTNAPGLPPAADNARAETPLRFDPKSVIAGLRATETSTEDNAKNATSTEDTEAKSSFFSRRAERLAGKDKTKTADKPRKKAKDKPPAGKNTVAPPSERRNLTVFGARDGETGGKPRHLGLILTIVLLVFLAGVAIWASLFLDDGVAGLLRRDPVPQIAALEVESQPVEEPAPLADEVETASLEPVNPESVTDTDEIEAMEGEGEELIDPSLIEAETDMAHPTAPTEQEAEARYAATGIWERAPEQPGTPPVGSTDTFYLTSIDRLLGVRDAVALPSLASLAQDGPLAPQGAPLPYGTTFDLDERGLVKATPQGAMDPSGVMVYLGRPAVLPKSFPERKPAPGKSLTAEEVYRLASLRPKARPDDLIEQNERASYGGRTLTELAAKRPRLRPESDKAKAEKDTTPTEAAVQVSMRPRARPSNFAQIVDRAQPREAVVASPVAATVTPSIPSSASVARQATLTNAINLNKINLIGVYGTTSSRRALVRLSNGRYQKVQVGDRIDGGKVAAISDTELRYVKSGKNIILKLPKG